MPEGEDASRMLPSDIPDPTRGVKDPVVLRKELKRLLEQMEQRDEKELEKDVLSVCRRAASATVENTGTGTLKGDLQKLLGRVKHTMWCLDVANNVFVRLEKNDARWKEGIEGESTWHRLDRLSVSLEQLRRDAEKAARDYAAVGADDSLSSSCDDFDLGPSSCGRHRPENSASQGRRRQESAGGRRSTSASSKRSGTASKRGGSGGGGGGCRRGGAGGAGGAGGGGGSSARGKTKPRGDRTGRKRSRQASSGGRRGSADGRYRDRMEEGEGESENDPPYLLGLDYGMAAEPNEADGGGFGRRGSSLSSSSARSSSSAASSFRSLSHVSPSPGNAAASRGGGGRDRDGSRGSSGHGRRRSGGAAHRRGSEARNGLHSRGRSGGNGGSRRGGGSAAVSRSQARGGGGGGGSRRLGGSGRGRRQDGRISGWAATTRRGGESSLAEQSTGSVINGRALAESIYRQRLAEQEARGGPQPYGDDAAADASGKRAESPLPFAVRQAQLGRALPFDGVRVEQNGDGQHRGGQPREEGGVSNPPRLVSLMQDLLAKPQLQPPLRFNTLYSRTRTTTGVQVDDLTLAVGGVDGCLAVELGQDRGGVHNAWDASVTGGRQPAMDQLCLTGVVDDQPCIGGGNNGRGKDGGLLLSDDERRGREDGRAWGGNGGGGGGEVGKEEDEGGKGGEVVRMLEILPQRMADVEELALADGVDDEAVSLANECCQAMAVVGVKLRALFDCNGRRPWRAKSLSAVKNVVERLAEACAPGRGLGLESGSNEHANSRGCSAGLSLTTAVELGENKKEEKLRSSVSVGSTPLLVETFAAMHMHLLQWLAVVACVGEDDDVRRSAAGAGAGGGGSDGDSLLLDFSRRLLVDLLFLLEKRLLLPATGGNRREGAGQEAAFSLTPGRLSRDPLAELLLAVMDALDGARGHESTAALSPAVTVSVPGLARPLVGFWGVFFEVISGGPSASSSGGGGRESGGACSNSWNTALPSELVWKTLIHAGHLGLRRRGWDDDTAVSGTSSSGGGSGRAPEERPVAGGSVTTAGVAAVAAAAAATAQRRKETSKAFWQCVRLLLAASPFAVEFCGSASVGGVSGQPLAVTVTATATAAALAHPRRNQRGIGAGNQAGRPAPLSTAAAGSGGASGRGASSSSPAPPVVEAAAESMDAPGMVARVLLERVLVLARFFPPEAGPQGVVERLLVGVQRLSSAFCVDASSSREGTLLQGRGGDHRGGGGVDAGEGGGDDDDGVGGLTGAWEREERRNRSARRVGRRSRAASGSPPVDLGRLLAAATEAWCLPAHDLCRLPRAVLERAGEGNRVTHGGDEGDYQALCSLTSQLTQEHAMRLPEGLKRRKLVNGLLKAKYSPPSGSVEARKLNEDDVHALAPSRVLLGIALGLARVGLVPDAAKELVKAAAVRPRNVSADTPRDRSIALIAPAATALCLALPVSDCVGSTGLRAKLFGVLAGCMRDAVELMARVLDGAGRLGQAVNLERLERPRAAVGLVASCILLALRHLGPLSQQPTPGASDGDRDRDRDSSGNNSSTLDASRAAATATAAAAAEAAEAFVEVLGRALERRFSDHLGRAALSTIMSTLLHCWPRSLLFGGSFGGDAVAEARGQQITPGVPQYPRSASSSSRLREAPPAAGSVKRVRRGYAMGWWSLEETGSSNTLGGSTMTGAVGASLVVVAAASVPSRPEASLLPAVARESDTRTAGNVPSILGDDAAVCGVVVGAGMGAGTDGRIIQPQEKDGEEEEGDQEMRDEYGSWDGFADDADLDALLAGCTPSQSQAGAVQAQHAKEGEEEKRRRFAAEKAAADPQAAVAAAAAAVAAGAAKEKEEEDKTWRYLAERAQMHVLPHIPEIIKKTWTMARYAQGTSLSSSSSFAGARLSAAAPESSTLSASRPPRLMTGSGRGLAGSFSSSGASGLAVTGVSGSHGGSSHGGGGGGAPAPSLHPSSPVLADSGVDANILLEFHASAALLCLGGSINSVNGNGGGGGGGGGDGTGVRQGGRGAGKSSGGGGGGRGASYHAVRDKYLDLHQMSHNSSSLVPQQRLLAPAFFCLALDRVYGQGMCNVPGKGNDGELSSQQQQQGVRGDSGSLVCDGEQGEGAAAAAATAAAGYEAGAGQRPDMHDSGRVAVMSMPLPKPTWPLLEALRGREWDMLHLWMQAALDPLAFPVPRGSSGGGSREPSGLVRKKFEVLTRCLSAAFAPDGLGVEDGREDGRGGEQGRWPSAAASSLDASVAGVFEKRLTRFEPAQVAALSSEEAKVLERVLDAQSVVAHCGALWASILGVSGSAPLPNSNRKRVKENVVRLVHSSIKSLRRFLPEVFPRTEANDANRGREQNASGSSARGADKGAAGRRPVARLPSRYSSTFRRLYGHAAYSVAAYLMRMCGGALRGLPLRELVEACFEGIACRPLVAANGGGWGGGGSGVPNEELTAMAVMHLPDLLQCFSEVPMTVPPVTEWMKNINDHAINGDPSSPPTTSSSIPTPLLFSLAAGLRGDLHYPSSPPIPPRRSAQHPSAGTAANAVFVELASAAALAPPPRRDPTAVSNRSARMRLEVLGDRKLRVARFLTEMANNSGARRAEGEEGGGGGAQRVSVGKVQRLLVLVAETFRCHVRRRGLLSGVPRAGEAPRAPGVTTTTTTTTTATMAHTNCCAAPWAAATGDSRVAASCSSLSSAWDRTTRSSLPPPLTLVRDILPLIRPVYSLVGQALLGEPGPARRLGRQALAAAVALCTAGIDALPVARAAAPPPATAMGGAGGERGREEGQVQVREVVEVAGAWQAEAAVVVGDDELVTEVRVAGCFADTLVLAVSTKLDTFLTAVGGTDGSGDSGLGLADLGPRESELEGLLTKMGAWEGHGKTTGWPHHVLFPTQESIARGAEGGRGEGDTSLPALLDGAEEMVAAFRSLDGGDGEGGGCGVRVLRRVGEVLVPRIEACRVLMSGNSLHDVTD